MKYKKIQGAGTETGYYLFFNDDDGSKFSKIDLLIKTLKLDILSEKSAQSSIAIGEIANEYETQEGDLLLTHDESWGTSLCGTSEKIMEIVMNALDTA